MRAVSSVTWRQGCEYKALRAAGGVRVEEWTGFGFVGYSTRVDVEKEEFGRAREGERGAGMGVARMAVGAGCKRFG